jgi:hypothetical protein
MMSTLPDGARTDRPMGDLTCKVAREWLEYRQRGCPHGFDPLHLAEAFGISEHTAIRYAANADS